MSSDDRYAAVLRRVWDDATFVAWGSPPPSAQFLWLYLLSAPTAGSIPGLLRFSLAETAERFNWTLEQAASCLEQITSTGRAEYDRAARLLYLPNALRSGPNAPRNSNVVKSWRRQWRELPECELKSRAALAFQAFLSGLGASFAAAWGSVVADEPTASLEQNRNKVETVPGTRSKQFREQFREPTPNKVETVSGTNPEQAPNKVETKSKHTPNSEEQKNRRTEDQASSAHVPAHPRDTQEGGGRAELEPEVAEIASAVRRFAEVTERCGGPELLAKNLHAALPSSAPPGLDVTDIARRACMQVEDAVRQGRTKAEDLTSFARSVFLRLIGDPAARGGSRFAPTAGRGGGSCDADLIADALASQQALDAEAEHRRRSQVVPIRGTPPGTRLFAPPPRPQAASGIGGGS